MSNLKRMVIITLLLINFSMGAAFAMGEKYSEQGNALSTAMDRELIGRGLCKSINEVNNRLPMYGGHANQVNFSVYKPDRKILAATFEFLIMHGLEITGGVPIALRVYPKSREEYGNIIFSPNPIILLEIKK
jgi:hypothetical protein